MCGGKVMKSSDDLVQGSIARSVQIPLLELTVCHQSKMYAQATILFMPYDLHFLPPNPFGQILNVGFHSKVLPQHLRSTINRLYD